MSPMTHDPSLREDADTSPAKLGRIPDYKVGRTSSTSKHSITSPTLMSS